jgi:hypothetical protein
VLIEEADMVRQTFLIFGLGLSLVLSSAVCADDLIAPGPRIYAQSSSGKYAIKILPFTSADKSEGVFFTLDKDGKEEVIWRTTLVNFPGPAIITENGKYVITLDTWGQLDEHCLVVYGEKGKVIADFKLEDLLTAKEIESIPRTVTMRGWHDKGIAEFEDRSLGYDQMVIRMKHKGWARVICLSLSSGKIVKD